MLKRIREVKYGVALLNVACLWMCAAKGWNFPASINALAIVCFIIAAYLDERS